MAARNLGQMKQFIGRKCQLTNSSGDFVDGNVSEGDVTSFLNTRKDFFYLKLVDKFPFLGEYEEPMNLVQDTNFYAFSDLTADQLHINYIGLKYSDSDTEYVKASYGEYNTLFKTNTSEEGLDTGHPTYRFSRNNTGDYGLSIYPTPSAAVTDGMLVRYVILPADLTSDSESFVYLPALSTPIVEAYAIADVWETKNDWTNSNQALNRAIALEDEFFKSYDPYGQDKPVKFNIGKTFNPFHR